MQVFRNQGKKASEQGFSLVELMVVVAIIGILTALALPRFRVFQAKARQAEAKNNLSQIYALEQSYYADNDTFLTFGGKTALVGYQGSGTLGTTKANVCNGNGIGFTIDPCGKARYGYYVDQTTPSGFPGNAQTADNQHFMAHAISGTGSNNFVYPVAACTTPDEWVVDQDNYVFHAQDAIASCNN